MKKFLLVLSVFTLLIVKSGNSQDYDNIFDDGNATAKNSVYFSSTDFLRGVPSLYYKYNFLEDYSSSFGLYVKIGAGMQISKPLVSWVPYYAQYLYSNNKNIENTRLVDFAVGLYSTDYFFGTNNKFESSLNYRLEAFYVDNVKSKVHNLTFGYGYNISVGTRFHLLL